MNISEEYARFNITEELRLKFATFEAGFEATRATESTTMKTLVYKQPQKQEKEKHA